jgi:hypothetical protein
MTVPRLFAIALIFLMTTAAWFILGTSVVVRTGESDSRLEKEVRQVWGGEHVQNAPEAWFETTRSAIEPVKNPTQDGSDATSTATTQAVKTVVFKHPLTFASSRIETALSLDERQKGLLWYATYGVTFQGDYRLVNTDAERRAVFVRYSFPSTDALYDGFLFRLNGREIFAGSDLSQGIVGSVDLPPGGEATLEVSYRSRGLGSWAYTFAPSGVGQAQDFALRLRTDCDGIDFPAGTVSPTAKTRAGAGWDLGWTFKSLVTGQRIGVRLPHHLNPGPLAARVTFFAPVGLLFFFTVLVVLGILSGRSLHPMNYFFVSAAFFAFHLLLAYLADHLNIHASFAIASLTSIALLVSYLRLIGGMQFACLQAGAAQLLYLVLFSYAFFFEGYTGLTITIGAIVTLFVLMNVTARVDWSQVFARPPLQGQAAGSR